MFHRGRYCCGRGAVFGLRGGRAGLMGHAGKRWRARAGGAGTVRAEARARCGRKRGHGAGGSAEWAGTSCATASMMPKTLPEAPILPASGAPAWLTRWAGSVDVLRASECGFCSAAIARMPGQPVSISVQSHRAGRAGRPGAGCRAGMCSKRMASARDREPALMTTVISTTEAAGCDVTMRWILGRWSEATNRVRSPIWARTRSVVQPTACLSGREPASISTITWANCLGNAVAWPGAWGSAAGPDALAGAGTWRGICGLVVAASRATGHAAPWLSQSYGGQPAGTETSRSPEDSGGAGWPGAASGPDDGVGWPAAASGPDDGVGWPGAASGPGGGAGWPGAVGGSGVRMLDGMFRLPGPENANGRERPGGRVRIRLRLDSFVPQATDISASRLVTDLSRAGRATFPD